MSLSESCWVLGGSWCVSLFYESPGSRQTSAYWLSTPPPPIDTCQNSNIETPGHVHLVLERASYLKATDMGADIFVVAW